MLSTYIKSSIDFWMFDCASLLENLHITEEKILKCSVHIILGVDNAVDKVFRNTEQNNEFRSCYV